MDSKINQVDHESNLKVIEWLKAELAESVGLLYKSLLKTSSEAAADALSNIIITCYVLGRRAGIHYQSIDMNIMHKINSTINEVREVEQMHGDLTELKKYFNRKESKTR